jgi:hypothetical protein
VFKVDIKAKEYGIGFYGLAEEGSAVQPNKANNPILGSTTPILRLTKTTINIPKAKKIIQHSQPIRLSLNPLSRLIKTSSINPFMV